MRRRPFVLAALVILAAASADAAPRGDSLTSVLAPIRVQFEHDLRDAESVFGAALDAQTKALRTASTTAELSATTFLDALDAVALKAKRLADKAESDAAASVQQHMTDAADDSLPGGLVGDGGSLDQLEDTLESDLEKSRARLLTKARKFVTFWQTKAPMRTGLTFVLPGWATPRRAAPSASDPAAPADETIRAWACGALGLNDGRVIVAACGAAAASQSGKFDLRLVSGSRIRAVGSFLAAGGMTVASDDTWSVRVTLNDPQQGDAVPNGNRLLVYGVEPIDGGLAGLQPTRMVHAGSLGIP